MRSELAGLKRALFPLACARMCAQIGGMVLHEGRVAEMQTGEGKTLVATLPAYLNALTGRGVHIVTVNDYLAKRDCEWCAPSAHESAAGSHSVQDALDGSNCSTCPMYIAGASCQGSISLVCPAPQECQV